MWYLYIAQCGDGSLYTGITTDPENRLKRHNVGRGSAYVRSKGTARLIYTEAYSDESSARRRENEVKSWSRQKKLMLVNAQRNAKQPIPPFLASPKSRRAMEAR